MADQDVRELERAVAANPSVEDGDRDARLALTRARLRSNKGVVAWWPGPAAPHPSAARTTLSYVATHPSGAPEKVVNCPGWSLAVASVEDFFDLGRVARSCTFLDLGTGDWFRGSSRRSATDIQGLRHQEEVTTVDAFGRPRATVRATPRAIDSTRDGPTGWGISTLVREESLYDTEWVPWESVSATLFQNYYTFQNVAPRPKQWGLDTNLAGVSGAVPQGYIFDMTGVTVEMFSAEGRPLCREDHEAAVGSGSLRFTLVQNPLLTWTLSAVTIPPLEAQGQDPSSEGYVIERPSPPLFPLAFPFVLRPLEQFQFRVERPPVGQPSRGGGFFLRVTLSGFLARGMAA